MPRGTRATAISEWGPSRTKQSEAPAADINNIVARFRKTGTLTHIASAMPQYGDYSNVDGYKEAVDQVMAAEAKFMELPPDIRAHVGNNVQNFIEFYEDEENLDYLVEKNLVESPEGYKSPAEREEAEREKEEAADKPADG